MHSRLDILYIILLNYQKFLYFDASVSILKEREFAHISLFYILFSSHFLKSLSDLDKIEKNDILDETKEFVQNNCYEILNHYLEKSKIISDESRDNIYNLLSTSALIKKENLKEVLFSSPDFANTFVLFNNAYCKLKNYVNIEPSALLTEFHNALSHIITAMVHFNDNNKHEIAIRNIDKAKSHLKRGTKDSYKIIIKCIYKLYEKNKDKNIALKMPKDFAVKFIEARSKEIIHLSDEANQNNVHDSLIEIADDLVNHFNLNNDRKMKEAFVEILKEYSV